MTDTARRRLGRGLSSVVAVLVIMVVATALGALAAGYRPVVIQTGSMGDAAPAGSLIIAQPTAAQDVQPGDILVMTSPDAATVTHRVVAIEVQGNQSAALTKGDANESQDPTPYPLSGAQLTSRWVLPGAGNALQWSAKPGVMLTIVAIVLLYLTATALRRVWGSSVSRPAGQSTMQPPAQAAPRRPLTSIVAIPLLAFTAGGASWAVLQATGTLASGANPACEQTEVASVQNGTVIHAVDGLVTTRITPVDPARSFVTATTRSTSDEPADSSLTVALSSAGDSIQLGRSTDAVVPPHVTVAWSVVEYACGVSVQRGFADGDGTSQMDIAISPAPPTQSFVLLTTASPGLDARYSSDDLIRASLTSSTELRVETGGGVLSPERSVAWQVVTFDAAEDIAVQRVSTTLGADSLTSTLALPRRVDPAHTFILTSLTAPQAGASIPDIGSLAVDASLGDGTALTLRRPATGRDVTVHAHVVSLAEGSTVRHGSVDFEAAQPTQTVVMTTPVPVHSTVLLTAAGADAGQVSATASLSSPTSLVVTRESTASEAGFGWQIIDWSVASASTSSGDE